MEPIFSSKSSRMSCLSETGEVSISMRDETVGSSSDVRNVGHSDEKLESNSEAMFDSYSGIIKGRLGSDIGRFAESKSGSICISGKTPLLMLGETSFPVSDELLLTSIGEKAGSRQVAPLVFRR